MRGRQNSPDAPASHPNRSQPSLLAQLVGLAQQLRFASNQACQLIGRTADGGCAVGQRRIERLEEVEQVLRARPEVGVARADSLARAGEDALEGGRGMVGVERDGAAEFEGDGAAQAGEGGLAVLRLRAALGGLGADAAGGVDEAHGGVAPIAVLSAGAGDAEAVEAALRQQLRVAQRQPVFARHRRRLTAPLYAQIPPAPGF